MTSVRSQPPGPTLVPGVLIYYFHDGCRSLAIIDPSGQWLGDEDRGLGSSTIRHEGCEKENTYIAGDCCYTPTVEGVGGGGVEGWEYKCNIN